MLGPCKRLPKAQRQRKSHPLGLPEARTCTGQDTMHCLHLRMPVPTHCHALLYWQCQHVAVQSIACVSRHVALPHISVGS
jgi:hypothetical protein